MMAELGRQVVTRISNNSIEASVVLNDYQQHRADDAAYNSDNNYYEQVQDDYELSADRVTIVKVSY